MVRGMEEAGVVCKGPRNMTSGCFNPWSGFQPTATLPLTFASHLPELFFSITSPQHSIQPPLAL